MEKTEVVPSKVTASEQNTATQAKVKVMNQKPYGEYLTDSEGRALYMFTADKKMESNCYEGCAEAWPPLLSEQEPIAGEKVKKDMLETIERKNEKMQVVYNGMPLYYYVKDTKSGQVTGQDIHSFGGEWYLVSPEGKKIEKTKKSM